jgi:hypothetical protein
MNCYVCGREFHPEKGEGFGYGCCSKKCYLKRWKVAEERRLKEITKPENPLSRGKVRVKN